MLLPGRPARSVVVAVTLAKTAVLYDKPFIGLYLGHQTECTDLLANRGETTSLAALVDGLGDPVDTRIPANLHRR